jgi:hypothetical protein
MKGTLPGRNPALAPVTDERCTQHLSSNNRPGQSLGIVFCKVSYLSRNIEQQPVVAVERAEIDKKSTVRIWS